MAKKDKKSKEAKKARMAAKNEKNAKKAGQKLKKQSKKAGDDLEDDVDLDELLKQLAQQQAEYEEVHVETVERPTKRLNATLCASNNNGKKELVLFGGEVNTEDSCLKTHQLQDLLIPCVTINLESFYFMVVNSHLLSNPLSIIIPTHGS
ncbi:unnamed protein product [Ambrosiozyma monospora]|uniref:Unnamed protein product n=1 Tax=Ambrosiozyma monospora TaxID=43982 RepID=A0ACB5TDR1_AMBMO|nr:unnamed protein product [Ambrosiozyma monospora]